MLLQPARDVIRHVNVPHHPDAINRRLKTVGLVRHFFPITKGLGLRFAPARDHRPKKLYIEQPRRAHCRHVVTTYIRAIRLGRWFPPGDELAASIARLVILREDFMLELHGIHAESLPELDQHSEQWRRTYFFRASVRTLREIRGCLTRISMNKEFKYMLGTRSAKERRELSAICARLNSASAVTKGIRDSLGGHVLHSAVQKAVDNLDYDRWGLVEIGRVLDATHFKVAGELVAEILTDGAPEAEKVAKIEEDIRTLADLLPVVRRLDEVLHVYVEARGLL